GLNALGSASHGFQAGPADFIDSHRGDIRQQPAAQGGLAGGVLSESCRDYVSHDDFIDERSLQTGTFNSGFDNNCAKLCCIHRFQSALKFSNGRTNSADDDDVFHGGKPPNSTYHKHEKTKGTP